jgi:uracil-DNA glycosylase
MGRKNTNEIQLKIDIEENQKNCLAKTLDSPSSLQELLSHVRECHVCEKQLPQAPKPVLQAKATARLLIIGQAPGARVHTTGIPWSDASGNRLRQWLALDNATFYDSTRVAIIPMGLCYPGNDSNSDKPPRPECAPLWHKPLLTFLPKVQLVLLVGMYAQWYYLHNRRQSTLTETVRRFYRYLPHWFPLPHPSWRNIRWQYQNPWFEIEVIPILRILVKKCLTT